MSMHFLLGVPGKLKTLMDRLTSGRAGYLDSIPTINTNAARLTTTRAGYIDYLPTINSRVTAAVATASALATVDSNVDSLAACLSQDTRSASNLTYSGDVDTVLSVSGAGMLVSIAVYGDIDATSIYITTDSGTQRTITLDFEHELNSDSNSLLVLNTAFSSQLTVKHYPGSTSWGRVTVIYALNK